MDFSSKRGRGARIILESQGNIFGEQSICFGFDTSNNQVNYEALIAKLRLTKELEVKSLKCQSNSQFGTGQVTGEYQAREPLLQK